MTLLGLIPEFSYILLRRIRRGITRVVWPFFPSSIFVLRHTTIDMLREPRVSGSGHKMHTALPLFIRPPFSTLYAQEG